MSKEARIEFISEGFHEILTSSGVNSLISSTADEIKSKAQSKLNGADGAFYSSTVMGGYGGGRWVAFVGAADEAAAIAESENKILTKAVNE